jgi:hypothetical protein
LVAADWGHARVGRSLVAGRVRSVLVPETSNVLNNPRHADAAKIQRLAVFPYPLDARLTSRN